MLGAWAWKRSDADEKGNSFGGGEGVLELMGIDDNFVNVPKTY